MAMSPYDLYNQNPQGGQVQVPVFDAHQAELLNNKVNNPDTQKGSNGMSLDPSMLLKLGSKVRDWYGDAMSKGGGFNTQNVSDMTNFITPNSLVGQFGSQAPSPAGANAITPTFQSGANVQAPSSQYGFNPNMYSGMFTGGK